jgi:hypothetical protein
MTSKLRDPLDELALWLRATRSFVERVDRILVDVHGGDAQRSALAREALDFVIVAKVLLDDPEKAT